MGWTRRCSLGAGESDDPRRHLVRFQLPSSSFPASPRRVTVRRVAEIRGRTHLTIKYRPICSHLSFSVSDLKSNRLAGI
jgi:hypothetical protein